MVDWIIKDTQTQPAFYFNGIDFLFDNLTATNNAESVVYVSNNDQPNAVYTFYY